MGWICFLLSMLHLYAGRDDSLMRIPAIVTTEHMGNLCLIWHRVDTTFIEKFLRCPSNNLLCVYSVTVCKGVYHASTQTFTRRCRYKLERNSGSLMTVGANATVAL